MSKRISILLISLFFISWVSQAQPITQATAIKIIPVNGTATAPSGTTPFRFDWTAGTGSNNIIVVIRDSTRAFTPVNNQQYDADTDFSQGTNLGSGSGTAKVVYNGLGSALTVTNITNLQAGTTYLIRIYEYSGTHLGGNNDESYNLNPASGNPIYFKYHTATPAGKWWTPPGVTAATVQAWGAGGGGGGTAVDDSSVNGGGGGAYASSPLTGLSGGYTITVGTGGGANETAGGQGADGGNSSFGSSVIAVGGDGGGTGSTAGGFGGGGTIATSETAASTGATRHAGGNGNVRIAAGNSGGGGGGGSAGTTGPGQLGGIATAGGTGGIAGVAGANGGAAGGAGGNDGAIGVAGSFPGGGGGGQGYQATGTTGSGAGGLVIVSYQPSAGLTSTASFTKNFIKNTTAQSVQVTFSAPVTGIPTITIDGDMSAPIFTNQVMTIGANASIWTFNAGSTWANNGEVFKVTVGTATNSNGTEVNPNPASNSFTVDNTAPTVSLTSSDANLIVRDANTVTITATFIETNGLNGTPTISIPSTVAPVSGANMVGGGLSWSYSWNVPSGDDASVSVSISAIDNAGNSNTAATGSVIYTIDNVVPTTNPDDVFTSSITKKGGTAVTLTPGSSTEFNWFAPPGTITFVAGPTMTTAAGDAASINAPASEGTYRLYVLDAAGNFTAQSTTILTVDNTGPAINISAPSATLVTNAASVTYTITYTDANNITLANGNISLNTSGASATVDVTGSGTLTRTVTLTNFTGNGTVGISIASGTAVDLYTNLSLAAGPSAIITVDNSAPGNQNTVFPASKASIPGAAVGITSSGTLTNRVWVAPDGTTNFVEGPTMTKSLNGTISSISAPATEGQYRVYVLDEVGNASLASTAILHVFSQATNLIYTAATTNPDDRIKFNWSNGTGGSRVVIFKTGGSDYVPSGDLSTSVNLDFNAGADLDVVGAGQTAKIVFSGSGSGFIEVLGLAGNTTYTIEVYEYQGAFVYLTPPLTDTRSTINGTNPTAPVSGLTFSNTTSNSITIQFNQGAANTGSASMLIARAGSAVTYNPVDGVSYTPSLDYSGGTDFGGGTKIIAQRLDADGTAIVMSGLLPDTDYHFAVVNFNGTAGTGAENYGLGAAILLGNRNTEPTTLANGFSFTSVGETSMTLNWSGNGNGDGRVVLMREGTAVLDEPTDNTTYTANGNFGFGNPPTASQIGSSYMVYDGAGPNATVTNLKPNTTYHFAIFEYNNTTTQLVPNKVYGAIATTPGQATTVDVTAPVPPAEVGALTVVGGTVVAGFWNSTNTQLQVVVPLPTSDGTIDGGTIQVRLKMTGGAFANIATSGISTAITTAERVAGSKTVTVNAVHLENVTTGFTEGNRTGLAAVETKFMLIGAKLIDLAGNPSVDYAQSLTKLDVDQTPPQISGTVTFSDGAGGAESVTMKFTEPIGLNNNDDPLIGTPGWSTTPATTINTGAGPSKYTTADSTLVLVSNANNDWTSATTITYTQGGAGNFIMDDLAGNEMQTVTKTMTDVIPPFLITGMVFNPNGAGKETITFSLSESLSLNENDPVTGFTPSVGSFDPALTRYTGKGTTNTITLTSSGNNQWPTDGVTIAYSGAGNVTDAFSLQLAAFAAEPILLKSIHIASNNALAPTAWAKLNDLVTVTFTTSRTLASNPAVTIGGQTAAFISLVSSVYTYRYNTSPDVLVNGGLAVTITANETGPPAKQTFTPVTTDGSAITYDKIPPVAPPNLDFGSNDPTNQDTGTSQTDNYTKTTANLFFSGTTAETGSTVRIYNGGSQVGPSANTTAGAWNITVPTLVEDVYVITAKAMDAAGNEGPPSAALTPSLTIDVSVSPPTAFDLHEDDDSGFSDADEITNHTTELTISGTSENFATIELWEGTQLATTPATITANGSGVWTADIDLAEGVHNITAKQIDRAGNISAVNGAPLVITVDVTEPSASAKPELDTNDDTGVSGTDYLTKKTSGLSFSSDPIEADAYVRIFKDGNPIGPDEYTFQADGSGDWTGDIALIEGVYSITTIVTDAAGNSSVASAGQVIEIDDTPPTLAPRSISSNGANPLFAKAGDVVTVSFTTDETLANVGAFVLAGDIDNDPLTFNVDDAPDYTAFITTDGTNTEDFLTFEYTVYDLAGNSTTHNTVSGVSSVKFDNTPPAISTIVVTPPPVPNSWSTSNGTGVTTVTYTVTFAEPVIPATVNPGDFIATGLGYAGNVSYPIVAGTVSGVAQVSPAVYTVTVNTVSNTGQLRLDLRATATILDNASINTSGGYTSGPTYSLVLPEPTNIQGTPTATTNGTSSVTVNWVNSVAVQTPTHLLITATGPDNQDPAVTPAEFIPTDGNTAIALRALPPEDANFADGKGLHIVNLTGALSTSYQFTTLLSGKTYTFKFYPVTLSPNNSAFPDNSNYLLTGIKSASATTQTASEGSIAAGTTAPPATIGSLTTAFGAKNFTFKLDDDGLNSGADVSATKFNTLTIKAGGSNTVANWQNVIAEAELKTITEAQTITTTNIVGNTIIFATAFTNDKEGELDDNEEKEYELRIRLKSSLLNGADSTVDNQRFDFYVDNTSFAFEAASSQFNGTESEASGSSSNRVTVLADRLVAVAQPPSTALVSVNVSPRAKLRTRDANGNTDLDYVKNVKITNAQSLPMNGLLASDSLAAVAGVIRLPINFQYADDGTGAANNGTLTVTGKASSLTNTNFVVLNNTTVSYSATTTITQGPLVLPSFIQSTTTSSAAPIAVFDFKINDDNNTAGDGSPTRITKIVITQGSSGNDIGTWTDLIADAELVYTSTSSGSGTIPFTTGVVNASNITFDLLTTGVNGEGYIADNDSKTYTLRIYLKTSTVSPATIDNSNLTFRMTNTASNITLATLSSNMTGSDFSSDPVKNEIKVDGTELRIVTQPVADILVNKDINLQPGQSSNPAVQVTDVNGNRDLDFGDVGTQTLTIVNAQSLPMSNVTTLPVNGLLTFANNFQYDGVGVGPTGNGTLTFTRSGLIGVSSQTVTVRVATSATITAGATTEAAMIASIVDTDPEKVEIFDFTISDDPGLADNNVQNDGNPIQITKIIITQNPAVGANTVSTWSDAIAAAFLSDGTNTLAGTIGATDITFGSVATPIPNAVNQLGHIADGSIASPSSKTYNLIIYLRPTLGGTLAETIDGLKLGFNVTSANITTLPTGTLIIGSENENSESASAGKGEVDVDATVIHFTTIPPSASVSVNLNPTMVAKARDVNGNRDLDFDNQAITAFGNTPLAVEPAYGTINGPLLNSTDKFDNGIFTFNTNLQFTSGAASTQFTLSAGGISGISPVIAVISSFESRIGSPKYKDLDGVTLYQLADSIPYVSHQSATLTDSYELVQLVVADGTADGNADGATPTVPGDLDGAPTILTELKLGVTNYTAIRKIAAYNDAGIKIADGNIVQVGASILGEVTFDFTGNEIIAADDQQKLFKIRATFQSSPTLISDTMHIRLSLRAATLGVGSKFYDVPPLSNTYLVGNPRSQVTAPADKNRLEVVATSLDFIKQPGNFAGIDQPIDINTADTTGIVHARDKFAVVDLNYNRSVSVNATANPNSYPPNFSNGVLDLSTMRYSTPGDGTLTVTTANPNGLSSINTPWATSIPAESVDVINVTAIQNTNNVLTTPNLKGGNVNQVIFGFTFTPQHVTTKEPKLKGFSITFKDDNGNPYFYKTAGSTVLKNFKILEVTGTGSPINVASFATVTQARSLRAAGSPFNAPATSFDMLTVAFDPSANYRPIFNSTRTYYLQVDVDVSTNIGTPAITPYLENGGYSDAFTRNNVILTEGSAKMTAIKGQTRSFASTKPPALVSSSPFNGQLNVDTLINTITLTFDVPVTTFDGKAFLYERYSNTLVATLTATNGNYSWAPGQSISPSPYITNPITFALPGSFDLKPDTVYYLTIPQGRFDPNNPIDRAGISDDGFNLFGGISFNGTLYFKAASKKPPVMRGTDDANYYYSKTTTTINAKFNQRGTAYYMITNTNPATPPNNAQIKGASYTTGTIRARGSFEIAQIEPSFQFGTVNTNLTPGQTYDVFMFAENDALPNPIGTSAPYGSSINAFIAGTGGPTLRFTVPPAPTALTNVPNYQICSNSYTQLSDPIIISEVTGGQFSGGAGVTQTINLLLPTGFQFDVNPDTVMVKFTGANFDETNYVSTKTNPHPHYEFINTTILKISFVNNGSSTLDNIVISDLVVIASAPDITGSIKRFSGNGIPLILDGHDFAHITSVSDPAINFTNSYSNVGNFGQAPISIANTVTYIPDNYVDVTLNQSAARLFPSPPKGDYGPTFFTGSGLTNDILNLTAVPLNTGFNITLTHTNMNGCISTKSDQYTVYNHKNAIAPLGTPSILTGERQICVKNQNFPGTATNQVIKSDSVSADGLAGYKLIELFANIPAKATVGSQIIFGPTWQALVKKIPKVYSAKLDANTLQTYRTYNWNYRSILNADSLGLLKPDSNFIQPPTPKGKTYFKGGSLGVIEFTGKYQSKADLTVFIPVRQEVEVFVPARPVVEQVTSPSFTTPSGTLIYCEGIIGSPSSDILINGYPAASPGSSTGFFTLRDSATLGLVQTMVGSPAVNGFTDNSNGTSLLKSSVKNDYKTIRVDYTYQDIGSPCSATGSFYIRITPNPKAKFAATSVLTSANPIDVGRPSVATAYCENNLIEFENKSTFPVGSEPYFANRNPEWNLGVSTALPQFTDSATFTYSTNGRYIVTFSVKSQYGCPSQIFSDSIYIGAIPNVAFSMNGISTATPVNVVDNSTVADGPGTNSQIFSAQWKYSPSNVFTPNATNTFATPGHYTITLLSTTQISDTDPGGNTLPLPGCERTIIRDVIIVPSVNIAAAGIEVTDNFESADPLKQWQTSSTNSLVSSWERGDASESSSIELPSNVWATDLEGNYNPGEVSFLYSPSFDLSNLIRPKVSFDHVSFMDIDGNDGVVLEFSTDTFNIADPLKKWYRIGTNVDGNNWYNKSGLASSPGDQTNLLSGLTSGDYGWATRLDTVLHSQHTLSPDIPAGKRKHVIFRFALASLPTKTDQGFTLDNFRVGERTRVVLIENFTNAGNTNLVNGSNGEFKESDFLKQNFNGVGTDIVKINYHVGFPSLDPFNDDYPADPSARALYYNIGETPLARMDGGKPSDPQTKYFSEWGVGLYNIRTLKLAQAELDISTPVVSPTTGEYEFSVTVIAKKLLSMDTTILHVAFLEALVPFSSLEDPDQDMIETGETTFDYVLKKMLPSALGTRFSTTLQSGQTKTFGPFKWTPDLGKLYDAKNDLAIVAFVQNEVTKEVYQAEILTSLADPALVTQAEDPDYERNISLFPNPANHEVNIHLPVAVTKSTPVEMFDTYGKSVYRSTFKAGEQTKTVSTTELTGGIYFIQMSTPDGNIARRKVMVVHR